MPTFDAKSGFALLCLLGVIAIGTGAVLEINRMRRKESIIGVNQFRLRLLSAVVWMIILGSTGYALLYLWPEKGDTPAALRFLSVVSGIILLLVIGFVLLMYDLWRVSLQHRQQQAQFNRQRDLLAQMEIEKRQATTHSATPEDAAPNDVSS